MNYWKLIMWDKEEIKVKPENVEFIQAKLSSGEGFIKTPNRSIAVKNIKDFVETSDKFIDQKLLESGARAFDTPMLNDDGSIISRWVKKSVTRRDYTKNYSMISAYRKIEDKDAYVVISWRQPVHQIDPNRMEELTPDDERNLSRRVA